MEINFKRNLSIGFGLSLLILLISSAASYLSIDNLLNSNTEVNHTNAIISELREVISTLKDAETGQRGYLLTGEKAFLEPYNGAGEKALKLVESIRQLTRDDLQQQKFCDQLQNIVYKRIASLKLIIDIKSENRQYTLEQLVNGKKRMDEARKLIKSMEERAESFLVSGKARQNLFTKYTPIIIIIAAGLAFLITIIFYGKLRKDYNARYMLEQELKANEQYISKRINIIDGIANKISDGDYQVRINNEEKDALGGLADSLNKMAGSLQYSFDLLSEKEWLQTGIAALNEKVIDETDISQLCNNIIETIAKYSGCTAGIIFTLENDNTLEMKGAYAYNDDGTRRKVRFGEGIVGRCAVSGKQILLEDFSGDGFIIDSGASQLKASHIIAVPVFYERTFKGVFELGSARPFSKRDLAFYSQIAPHIGTGINSVQGRVKVQQLLEETQSQTEELKAQHWKLQHVNEELEANTRNIKASEELLKVQQENLMEVNVELEARTALLEESNRMITERNIEIQTKSEELRLSAKYKSEFLTNMSHELRTPLNSILLLSGLMVENNDNSLTPEHIEYAKVINNSGNGLLELIDEILDLSKIESGKMEIYYEEIRVADIVGRMRELFEPVAKQKKIELDFHIDPDVSDLIETDRLRLEQILKNLLSNALKFTPAQGKVSFLVANDSFEKNHIIFTIRDNGIGIAPDKQQLIFDAFQQADGSTQRQYGGTGLGLSISRELIRLLNGNIVLSSQPGKGSEFTVYLPNSKPVGIFNIAPSSSPGITLDDGMSLGSPPSELIGAGCAALEGDDCGAIGTENKSILIIEDDAIVGKTVLVADDDVRNIFSLTRVLESYGMNVLPAMDGKEVLQLIKNNKPIDIVVMNITMPEMNGYEIMEQIRMEERLKELPIIFITDKAMRRSREKCISSGASDCITKPIDIDQLVSMLRVWLYEAHYHKGTHSKPDAVVFGHVNDLI